ncbi:MAG TPA: hypothetical protein VFN66_07640 [Burkholderiales bacterium]|nr:hypothetical protein [Burkholderiales bacterium]
MNISHKLVATVMFTVAIVLFLFGSGTMTVAMLDGGMMWNSAMGGISWMWIPPVLMLALFVLFIWVIFELKE